MTRTHVRIVVKAGEDVTGRTGVQLTDGRYWAPWVPASGASSRSPPSACSPFPPPRRRLSQGTAQAQGAAHLQAAHRPSRRAAPPLQVRPDPHHPGPEHDHIAPNDLRPNVPGYITKFVPEPQATGRHASRASTSSTCTTASGSSTATRRGRRRGEDDHPRRRGLRLVLQAERPVAHELHDPQPHAERRHGLHHLRHRLHPGTRRRRRASRRSTPRGWTSRASRPTRSSTPCGPTATSGGLHLSRQAPTDPYKGGRRATSGRRPRPSMVGTAGHLHPGGGVALTVTRGGKTVRLFTSKAHYYEPRGRSRGTSP